MRVWEGETGHMVYQVTDPHESGNPITALTLDEKGYRLATGAFNGKYRRFFLFVLFSPICMIAGVIFLSQRIKLCMLC